ncbi:hypothetical protein TIFTF001_030737 [Ficus carica]|uniref:Uncharacterized protein n=1 Tax=Ficus carica TaxID=3494 RepID=A0AA88DYJ3_FICCA|nr:hypothetical protein TIFTF001_030737 [Ficus carica]
MKDQNGVESKEPKPPVAKKGIDRVLNTRVVDGVPNARVEDGVPKDGVDDKVPKDGIVADKENRKGGAREQREWANRKRGKRKKGKRNGTRG